ncbi:MAG TPA: glycosyltransferase [Anaerolineae bacterium]|nr:glycosyltransferase [Anaerolineae bacterium]
MLMVVLVFSVATTWLALYGLHVLGLVVLYLRHRRDHLKTIARSDFPIVTVQLPMYNEPDVVERMIDAAANLDWPHDRLQIQVLDDSTDRTTSQARARVDAYRARGLELELLHRSNRAGYKAGALSAGLEQARGEFIAIFDADFVPAPDFLKQMLPHFVDRSIGFVQARWDHLPTSAPLARALAIAVDGHFIVEQFSRNRSGLPMIFNGSAGVWRRECIELSGGWAQDTLCEDMDLSMRAAMQGWRCVFVPDVTVLQEEPEQVINIKTQHGRWAKGGAQCLRKLSVPLLTSKLTWRQKFFSLMYLGGYAAHLMMLIVILAWLPLAMHPQWLHQIPLTFLGIGGIGLPLEHVLSQIVLYRDWRRKLLMFPLLLAIGFGMTLNNAWNVIEGLLNRSSEFKRTPKRGANGHSSIGIDPKQTRQAWIELVLSIYTLISAGFMIQAGQLVTAFVLVIYSIGFALIGGGTLQAVLSRTRLRADRSPRSMSDEVLS